MLHKVTLTNFKCFDFLELDCKPLNLLCGLNGMGKSSVIQALLVLRQSFETGQLDNDKLVISGERADLGTGSDILFEDAENDLLSFALESDNSEAAWKASFAYAEDQNVLLLRKPDSVQSLFAPNNWRELPPFGGDFVYVNAERVGPRKTYPLSGNLAILGDYGTNSEYAWNYLLQHSGKLLHNDDPRIKNGSRRLSDVVEHWMQTVSPGVHLRSDAVRAADAIIPGFTFDREGDVASMPHRATNVGFGLSYTLPVVLSLLSDSETLCLVENPEAHLHPRGQTRMAELAARATMAGVQIFVETHSDHFMDGVRIAVRDGLVKPEDVAFHYFEREGNKSIVTTPEIDADGRLSSWPAGFFDQHDENLMRLLASRT